MSTRWCMLKRRKWDTKVTWMKLKSVSGVILFNVLADVGGCLRWVRCDDNHFDKNSWHTRVSIISEQIWIMKFNSIAQRDSHVSYHRIHSHESEYKKNHPTYWVLNEWECMKVDGKFKLESTSEMKNIKITKEKKTEHMKNKIINNRGNSCSNLEVKT